MQKTVACNLDYRLTSLSLLDGATLVSSLSYAYGDGLNLTAVNDNVAPAGILIATYRPVEFWRFRDKARGTEFAAEREDRHRTQGFAYTPHNGSDNETYGDISLNLSFFEQPGWKVAGYDRSLTDLFQVAAILKAI